MLEIQANNKTFLLKALPIFFFLIPLLSSPKEKKSEFYREAKEFKKSPAELQGTVKFLLSFKLSTYSAWSAAIKNMHPEQGKVLFSFNLKCRAKVKF